MEKDQSAYSAPARASRRVRTSGAPRVSTVQEGRTDEETLCHSLGSLAALLLLLLALHLALPYLVRDYLNGKLADMGDYRGHIADVDLALWRGAYRIDGLSIVKDNGKVPVPFLDAPSIDLSVSWQALWDDHAVVARVVRASAAQLRRCWRRPRRLADRCRHRLARATGQAAADHPQRGAGGGRHPAFPQLHFEAAGEPARLGAQRQHL